MNLSLPLEEFKNEMENAPMDFHLSNDIIMTVNVRLDSTLTLPLFA